MKLSINRSPELLKAIDEFAASAQGMLCIQPQPEVLLRDSSSLDMVSLCIELHCPFCSKEGINSHLIVGVHLGTQNNKPAYWLGCEKCGQGFGIAFKVEINDTFAINFGTRIRPDQFTPITDTDEKETVQ